ncbi:MAG: hypothetical protein ACP5LE_08130, partial [Thermoplasmata archaeon]
SGEERVPPSPYGTLTHWVLLDATFSGEGLSPLTITPRECLWHSQVFLFFRARFSGTKSLKRVPEKGAYM